MYTNGSRDPIIDEQQALTSEGSGLVDLDPDIDLDVEIEQKWEETKQKIASFRAQQVQEFQDFKKDLRESRKRKGAMASSLYSQNPQREGLNKPPSRTSSSSALNLLAGYGTPKQPRINNRSLGKFAEAASQSVKPKSGPSTSEPVVLLDKLTINGETAVVPARTPCMAPAPVSLSRNLPRSSSSSSLETMSSNRKKRSLLPAPQSMKEEPKTQPLPHPSPDEDKSRHSFTGLFTPTYLHLFEQPTVPQDQSSSAVITPPAEEEVSTAPSSYKSTAMGEALPVSSSSFPPHVTMSPNGGAHNAKRSYTAPTGSRRMPSALRTSSSTNISRKTKHVTFRLADSAIVEPSSSYEEGPSPGVDEESAPRSKSGTRSPLRSINSSSLSRTLSPDEEDAEAGVEPGMGMGDVIQRLNDYTIAEAAKNGEDLVLEVEEGEEIDVGNEVGDDDDDVDIPMEIHSRHEENVEDDSDRHVDIKYHEHDDDDVPRGIKASEEDDGYFSPKAGHVSTMSSIPRGNSPLTPYHDSNWAELSSSDKDRLLFESRRHSDDGNDGIDAQQLDRRMNAIDTSKKPATGFSGSFEQGPDGGSGVGFFELDEELASPDAGQARPFTFDTDMDEADAENGDDQDDQDEDSIGLELSSTMVTNQITIDNKKRWSGDSAKFGAGSLPIDIVRPSPSVTGSWIGTFGH